MRWSMRNFDPTEAARVFRRALKIDPKYMHAAHLYGLCLHGMGQTRKALTQFESCLQIDPSHAACTQFRGTCERQINIRIGSAR